MNLLVGYLAEAAIAAGESPAILTLQDQPLTYRQLYDRALRLAHGLQVKLGIQPGDRVGIVASNHRDYMTALFGAWSAGASVAPMNAKLHAVEIVQLLKDCGAKACFITPEIYRHLPQETPGLDATRLVVLGEDSAGALMDNPPLDRPVDVDATAVAWLFYTSGTTGRPKGAMLSHRNLAAMVESFLTDSGCADHECLLHLAPMSHAGGLFGLAYVKKALPQLVPPQGRLDARLLADCFQLAGNVTFFAVPTMLMRLIDPTILAKKWLSNIHRIIFGGAPMYVADLRLAIDHFGPERLWGAYGQGESPCTITHVPPGEYGNRDRNDFEELLGSVGVPRTGVEVGVVDGDDQPLPPGATGEVVVRGDVVMAGYWNRPKDTSETLRNGWLHTGDLGRIGETGLLTLVDRAKDMIISGGTNIYPREIEETLLMHPLVLEAAVVGRPDKEWGELPVAFVVSTQSIDASDLEQHCLNYMARFKRPREYFFSDSLPKSSYGKVLKSTLRESLDSTINQE